MQFSARCALLRQAASLGVEGDLRHPRPALLAPLRKQALRLELADGAARGRVGDAQHALRLGDRDAGSAEQLVGERKRTNIRVDSSNHWVDESFEIKVRNRKKEAVEIRVVEHLYRWSNWTIAEKSQDFVKTDAQTIEFRVALKPDEEKVVTYKVHYTW